MAVDTIDYARKFTLLSQAVPNPAAGADWSVTVPAGEVWRLFCLAAVFVTSATVATRVIQLQIKDAAGNVLFKQSSQPQAAGVTGNFSWAPALPNQGNNNINIQPIPMDLVLPEGFTISTQTASLQAGDQWQSIVLLIGQGASL